MRVHIKTPTTFTVDSAEEGIDVLPDSGGSDDVLGSPKGNGGAGGSNNGGNDDKGSKGSGKIDDHNKGSDKKAKALLMSQKLTLGYATLVGVGGIIGYLKNGSQKSLIAGGGSVLLLYCVYTMLPTNPVLASSLGFGILPISGQISIVNYNQLFVFEEAVNKEEALATIGITAVGGKGMETVQPFKPY
ncbi:FATTY ACID EXPORT 2, chloroplastic-like [Olea europaea subsp. europaea]|uniref:FATTY ACID EXPORT 2, chloroplastic-like n=1 Tax=Olea europaea subsp. europaea TaxID=158383 RepID=A0A8S0QR86_OLEEU|nr:FATTY ACID EXPORT 2, chloroplastic-like [Olea europaea subsp. europaea]